VFKDEAMEILLDSLSSEENDRLQELAVAFLSKDLILLHGYQRKQGINIS
jgi:hypothetical protein